MDDMVIEWAPFRTRPGVDEAALLEAARAIETAFLARCEGFVRRELARRDGGYVDIVWWRSRADADAAMAKTSSSEACGRYFGLMDFDPADPAGGMTFMTRLHASR
jgi:hypothetical protein